MGTYCLYNAIIKLAFIVGLPGYSRTYCLYNAIIKLAFIVGLPGYSPLLVM